MLLISSVLIFILSYCEANGNVIRPNQPSVVLTEGSNITLSCTYDVSAYSLHWYQQKPGSRPEFLLLIVKSTKTEVPASPPLPHMSIKLHNDNRVDLEISSAAVSDAAVYYCALQPTVTGNANTLYKNLLIWYRQYPGSKPENLIVFFETIPKSDSSLRLTAVADKGVKHMNLTISSTEVKDSAMYYCALMLLLVLIIFSLLKENVAADVITPLNTDMQVLEGKDVTLICNYTGNVQNLQWYQNVAADVITPLNTDMQVLEGKDVTLICNYTGNVQNLQWYRQYPGSKPENLIVFYETIPKSEPSLRLTAVADKGVKQMNLTISSTEVKDSAMYYCALQPTVTGNTTAPYKNSIRNYIQNRNS
ncbi:hypothetical protein PO909_031050 [Leuciscus waleckii]